MRGEVFGVMRLVNRKVLVLVVLFLTSAFVAVGCDVTIVGPPLVFGDVRVCTSNSSYYARVYIDGNLVGIIDGWGMYAPQCTGWYSITLNETHRVVLRDVNTGVILVDRWVTPTYDGYTIEIY
ncbi:MAG: hypothetical protein PWP42_308 [Candidatus Atribacteria bacterium]|uniref:hypothetical protein n=1 Tax=Atrimonas thermophila TaxID=3064161 RepID=UPI0024AA92DD|nr:hypothetical protein [Candidatus Atribacteria bacterium]